MVLSNYRKLKFSATHLGAWGSGSLETPRNFGPLGNPGGLVLDRVFCS